MYICLPFQKEYIVEKLVTYRKVVRLVSICYFFVFNFFVYICAFMFPCMSAHVCMQVPNVHMLGEA